MFGDFLKFGLSICSSSGLEFFNACKIKVLTVPSTTKIIWLTVLQNFNILCSSTLVFHDQKLFKPHNLLALNQRQLR